MPTSERDQRISELATGFALGELDDGELKEFYDLLREPGDSGAAAGQIAWETLGTMVDLRAQMGSAFQDTLYLRLAEGGKDDARFATKIRNRLGRSRPRLQPVEAPGPSDRPRSWAPWIAGTVLLVLVGVALLWPRGGEGPVARVVSVAGGATQDGRGLVAGQAVDRRQLLVPTGALLTLGWSDGSRMTLAGPASAVAGSEGLSLLGGQAWWNAVGVLSIGLPDRSAALPLPPGSRGALAIRDNRTTVALASGRLATAGANLAAGQALELSRPDEPYAWQQGALAAGAVAAPGGSAARWRLSGVATWKDTTGSLSMRGRDRDGGEVVVRLAPGSVVLEVAGREVQRAALGGAPLAERPLEILGDGTSLSVLVSSQRLELPLAQPITGLAWLAEGAADLAGARFTTGPDPEPAATP
jgi:hypothetical protein